MHIDQTLGTAASAVAVGTAATAFIRSYIRRETAQLRHNGGTHVADYARDARDESRQTNEKLDKLSEALTQHLIQSAAKEAEQDAKLGVLLGGLVRPL
jgi:hypothetical protein